MPTSSSCAGDRRGVVAARQHREPSDAIRPPGRGRAGRGTLGRRARRRRLTEFTVAVLDRTKVGQARSAVGSTTAPAFDAPATDDDVPSPQLLTPRRGCPRLPLPDGRGCHVVPARQVPARVILAGPRSRRSSRCSARPRACGVPRGRRRRRVHRGARAAAGPSTASAADDRRERTRPARGRLSWARSGATAVTEGALRRARRRGRLNRRPAWYRVEDHDAIAALLGPTRGRC